MKIHRGEETKKALGNFDFGTHETKKEFVLAIVTLKKAAALANYKAGEISLAVRDAILCACNEILSGKHDQEFLISYLQGGAGTASHVNANEVISSLATGFLHNKTKVHPNNDVNRGQSTNDVNPSALRIALVPLLEEIEKKLFAVTKTFDKKARQFKGVYKLGRTHLQDAVPTTLGAEFLAYSVNLSKHKVSIKRARNICLKLNMGGTAIGNSINASPTYLKEIYRELSKITGKSFLKANNLMAHTSSQTDFLLISQALVALTLELSKIANDLRFMSSGPNGGIGEIVLPELQNGSTIMPGKVNPVMAEAVNQLYYIVSGNNLMIEKAAEHSQMELGVMLPVIVDKLIESSKLTSRVIEKFDKLCISGIEANIEKCTEHLEKSSAYATLLVPRLGYDEVSAIVKESVRTGMSLREITISKKYLTEKEFDKIKNSFKN
jgi:aspartate ammonia-lyase